jgi:hypothetical protein
MKIRLRKAKLDLQKASKLASYNTRPANQEFLSQKKKLIEQLRSEGRLQQFIGYEPINELEFEHLNMRVESYFDGLLDSLENGRYINDKLKNQLFRHAFGILNAGVEHIMSSVRARLSSFGYTGGLADETLSAIKRRIPSIQGELTNKFEVKILKLNEEYKGCLRIWMEHPFWGEVIRAIVKYVVPALIALLFGSYFINAIKKFVLNH